MEKMKKKQYAKKECPGTFQNWRKKLIIMDHTKFQIQ